MAYDKWCSQLSDGGLEFRTIEDSSRNNCGVFIFSNYLISWILGRIYFKRSNSLKVQNSNIPSYGWKIIMETRQLLTSDLRKTIDYGLITRVWSEP